MYREINIGSNFLLNTFLLLIDFINSKNVKLNLNVVVDYNKNLISETNTNEFFKLGQLLMFFYVTNTNGKHTSTIGYKQGRLYAEISETDGNESYIDGITSENIIYKLVDKSTYNKKLFLEDLNFNYPINNKNLLDIQSGFKLTYKTFIKEKISLINFLNECESKNIYFNLIKDIQLLNYHDLKIQINLIKLKFRGKMQKNKLLKEVISSKHNYNEFIKNSKNLLELLIKNGIISFYNNKVELMWLGYIDNEPKPIKYMNIYIATYFSYIAQNTQEKHYLQSAKNTLNPLIDNISNLNTNYMDSLGNDYEKILKLLYLLSNYIEYDELNKAIEKNKELFSNIKLVDKLKSKIDVDNLILESIYNDSLNLLNLLILG